MGSKTCLLCVSHYNPLVFSLYRLNNKGTIKGNCTNHPSLFNKRFGVYLVYKTRLGLNTFLLRESVEQSMSLNQIGSFYRSTSYSQPMISTPLLLCTDAVISFSPGLPPTTTGCQRPEAYLTALHRSLQAAWLSDCCNMLHISLGTHTEYNHHRAPHQSLAMPHPRSLLLR